MSGGGGALAKVCAGAFPMPHQPSVQPRSLRSRCCGSGDPPQWWRKRMRWRTNGCPDRGRNGGVDCQATAGARGDDNEIVGVPFDEYAPFNTGFSRPRGRIEPSRGDRRSSARGVCSRIRSRPRVNEENRFGGLANLTRSSV